MFALIGQNSVNGMNRSASFIITDECGGVRPTSEHRDDFRHAKALSRSRQQIRYHIKVRLHMPKSAPHGRSR